MNRNSGDEFIHHTPIENWMLHDAFEREYINLIGEHVEYMDAIVDHTIEKEHLV